MYIYLYLPLSHAMLHGHRRNLIRAIIIIYATQCYTLLQSFCAISNATYIYNIYYVYIYIYRIMLNYERYGSIIFTGELNFDISVMYITCITRWGLIYEYEYRQWPRTKLRLLRMSLFWRIFADDENFINMTTFLFQWSMSWEPDFTILLLAPAWENSNPMFYYISDSSLVIRIGWKTRFVVNQFLAITSLQNFTHATTDRLCAKRVAKSCSDYFIRI